jgi:hypothetical protein
MGKPVVLGDELFAMGGMMKSGGGARNEISCVFQMTEAVK